MNNVKCFKMFFSLSWKLCPSYIIALVTSTLLGSGQIWANIILPKFLIDELTGERSMQMLVLWGGLIVASNLLFGFLNNTMKKITSVKNVEVKEKFDKAFSEKIMKVEFSYLENPYYLDLKEKAVFATNNQGTMRNLVISLAGMLKSLFTIIGLMAVMFTLSWVLVVVLIATVGLMLLIQKSVMSYQVKFFNEIIPVNRKYGYYMGLCELDKIQKDIRLYGMSEMLSDRVTEYNKEINSWFTKFYLTMGKYLGIYSIINDLQAAIAYGYVGLRVVMARLGNIISIGSFTMYVSSAISFAASSVEMGKNVVTVMQMIGYLQPFMEFMSLPDEDSIQGTVPFQGEIESIRFEKVSFKYPGSEKMVIEDISFSINKGEKISIVGLNGAGKTTLIKLICRLYHPTSGTIYINDRDIFEYEHSSYMKQLSAVFQDYKLFDFSIEENITGKDPGKDTLRAEELIEQVGLKEKMQELPNGIKSLFGKAYDESGIEMSGGQGQKVAIARALYKGGSLIILDEPTSALDPLAEAEIYESFNSLIGERTAIYISHRMSSSVFCDRILVLNKGGIEDYDTHEKLMEKKNSMYYKLFNAQAVNYKI
jgi:ABC-type multidrug transport system fused ATPase/permease subunit